MRAVRGYLLFGMWVGAVALAFMFPRALSNPPASSSVAELNQIILALVVGGLGVALFAVCRALLRPVAKVEELAQRSSGTSPAE